MRARPIVVLTMPSVGIGRPRPTGWGHEVCVLVSPAHHDSIGTRLRTGSRLEWHSIGFSPRSGDGHLGKRFEPKWKNLQPAMAARRIASRARFASASRFRRNPPSYMGRHSRADILGVDLCSADYRTGRRWGNFSDLVARRNRPEGEGTRKNKRLVPNATITMNPIVRRGFASASVILFQLRTRKICLRARCATKW